MSLKSRAIIATIRAANQLRAKKELKSLKSHVLRVKGKKTEAKLKFKQKPKHPHGGPGEVTQTGSYFGIGGKEAKLHSSKLAIALKHPRFQRWPHDRESWRSQMDRMYGGVHMSLDPKGIKKSIKLLTKKKHFKKKKIKKATEGGEVVIHANVDRSLL